MWYHFPGNIIFANSGDKSLPIEGWFQNCILCYCITSRMRDYLYQDLNYKLYICHVCNKNIKYQKVIKLIDKIVKNTTSKNDSFSNYNKDI